METTIQKGDFITIDYVGRVKETGKIFDLTREDIAKKEGLQSDNAKYGPITVVVGAKHVIPGLDKKLIGLNVGDNKTFDIAPVDAFGNKDTSLVKLIPRKEFTKQKMNPVPGFPVRIEGQYGIIQSVSGGRVKVDFNHPLAGKELSYEVEIQDKIEEDDKKVKSLFRFHLSKIDTSDVDVKLSDKIVTITTPKSPEIRRYINMTEEIVSRDILSYMGGVETVKFIDVFEKSKPVKTTGTANSKSNSKI